MIVYMKISIRCEMLLWNNTIWQQCVPSTNLQDAGWSYEVCGLVLQGTMLGLDHCRKLLLMVHPHQVYLLTLLINIAKKRCWLTFCMIHIILTFVTMLNYMLSELIWMKISLMLENKSYGFKGKYSSACD